MDDLVARDRRGPVRTERLERRRLAGADPARDGDRDRMSRRGRGKPAPTRSRRPRPRLRARRSGFGLRLRLGLGDRLDLVGLSGLLGARPRRPPRRPPRRRPRRHRLGGRLCLDRLGLLGLLDDSRLGDDLVGVRLGNGLSSASAASAASTASVASSSAPPRPRRRPPVGNASSESFRSGVECTDAAPSARGTGTAPSSTRFSESESRRRSPSISRMRTFTGSPCETTSRGFSTWWLASSEMCTSPSTPGRISTKAPNVTTFVTRPSTTSSSW